MDANRRTVQDQSEQALWETLRRAQNGFREIIAAGSREEFAQKFEHYIQALQDYDVYLSSRLKRQKKL
jgi:hypothetical protein